MPQSVAPPPRTTLDDDACYEAIRVRDTEADGRFFTCVLTTGVYCRPTCGARLPLRRNVRFVGTPEEAEEAGFRACRRCRPRDLPRAVEHASLVRAARSEIEGAERPLPLDELAARLRVSSYHLHRLFKQHTGLTPRAYAGALRMQRAASELREGAAVLDAAFGSGYGSAGRFYADAGVALGMTPSTMRRGAAGIDIRATVRASSLGPVLIAATDRGLCTVAFVESEAPRDTLVQERYPRATLLPGDAALDELADAVLARIEGAPAGREIPLDLLGTAFQQRVWRELCRIPAGETAGYAAIAARIGSPRAARAVGTACGENPVAVVVPCHRVLRGDGSLGGYKWGLDRKRALLAREQLHGPGT